MLYIASRLTRWGRAHTRRLTITAVVVLLATAVLTGLLDSARSGVVVVVIAAELALITMLGVVLHRAAMWLWRFARARANATSSAPALLSNPTVLVVSVIIAFYGVVIGGLLSISAAVAIAVDHDWPAGFLPRIGFVTIVGFVATVWRRTQMSTLRANGPIDHKDWVVLELWFVISVLSTLVLPGLIWEQYYGFTEADIIWRPALELFVLGNVDLAEDLLDTVGMS